MDGALCLAWRIYHQWNILAGTFRVYLVFSFVVETGRVFHHQYCDEIPYAYRLKVQLILIGVLPSLDLTPAAPLRAFLRTRRQDHQQIQPLAA